MKSKKLFSAMFIFAYFLSLSLLYAQDIYAYRFIGQPRAQVVKEYGKPVHTDKSDPTMVCMFYKKNNNQMIFVSDESSIYQIEVTKAYTSESSAMEGLDNLLKTAYQESFKTDTLSANEYELKKVGISFNAWLMHNSNLSTFEVRIKATRR